MSALEILAGVVLLAVGFAAGLAWPAFMLWWIDFVAGMTILAGKVAVAACVIAGVAYLILR